MRPAFLAIHAAIVVLSFYFGPRPCPVFPYPVVLQHGQLGPIPSAGVYGYAVFFCNWVGGCGENKDGEN